MRVIAFLLAVGLLISSPAYAHKVIGIADGDTPPPHFFL